MGIRDGREEIVKRQMVVFFIIGTSSSMRGTKITAVNESIRGLLPELQDINGSDIDKKIAVLAFSDGCKWMYPTPIAAESFTWQELQAEGGANLGAACVELNKKLSRHEFFTEPSGSVASVAPVIILMTDSEPTDNFEAGLAQLRQNNWFKHAIKVAVAIGDGANKDILVQFTDNIETVITVLTPEMLKKWIMRSTIDDVEAPASELFDDYYHVYSNHDALLDQIKEIQQSDPDLCQLPSEDDWGTESPNDYYTSNITTPTNKEDFNMEFKKGETIPLEGGKSAKIVSKLGEGGQGIVYAVKIDGKDYALKWYTCKLSNKKAFRKNLQDNIARGAPDGKFLWPLYLTEERDGSFGYVMNLRPKEYVEFSDILNNKVNFSSTETLVMSALNIVNAFRELHIEGFSYQDLNDGGFFINVKTGDVLICDNDNVTPGGIKNPGNVGGKPGYMAPEVFRGDTFPGVLTDNYSLAVILFKLFCLHDPLMGKAYVDSVCITEKREMELYGTHPVFIFNPQDDSNRPVQGIHANPLKIWPRLPQYIRDAFITSFVDGIKNPNKRLPDNEWQKNLFRFLDEIMVCPLCGSEHMIYKFTPGQPMNFACKHTFSYPRILHVKSHKIPLFPGTKIRECHVSKDSDDYAKVVGEVIMSKHDSALWGIKNLSDTTWTFPVDGQLKTVGNNSVVPIAQGMEINFGNTTGTVEK